MAIQFDKSEYLQVTQGDGTIRSIRNRDPNILGDRFISRNAPAWHTLGTVFTDAPSATEGTRRAGADYEITSVPIIVNAYGQEITTGQFALVREPLPEDAQPRVFGVASGAFNMLLNREVAAILDPLCEEYPLETVAVLGQGERAFWCFDGGLMEVAGESIKSYLTVMDPKLPGQAMRFLITPVRTECQNTLMMGMLQAVENVAIPHLQEVRQDLSFYVRLMNAVKAQRQQVEAALNRLAVTQVVEAQIDTILKAAYPEPPEPAKVRLLNRLADEARGQLVESDRQRLERRLAAWENDRAKWSDYRATSKRLYDRFCDEFPNLGGTAWAIYNAVVEHEDWVRKGHSAAERAESGLFGERAQIKARSFAAAMQIAL